MSGGMFEWFRRALNSVTWTLISSSPTLQFNRFRVSNAGYYACVVTVGNDFSRTDIFIDVASMIVVIAFFQ